MNIGQVVCLASDKERKMSVGGVSKYKIMVKCQWVMTNGAYQEAWFYPSQLLKSNSN